MMINLHRPTPIEDGKHFQQGNRDCRPQSEAQRARIGEKYALTSPSSSFLWPFFFFFFAGGVSSSSAPSSASSRDEETGSRGAGEATSVRIGVVDAPPLI